MPRSRAFGASRDPGRTSTLPSSLTWPPSSRRWPGRDVDDRVGGRAEIGSARSGRRHPIDPSLARHGRQRSSRQDGQYCGDHVVIAPGRAARAGLLAASVTLLVLLLAPLVLNADGFLEAVHNGVTKYFPTGLLDLGIGTFGPYAKGLLFVGVCAGVLGAGALTGWLLARYAGLGMGGPIYETVFVSGLTFL